MLSSPSDEEIYRRARDWNGCSQYAALVAVGACALIAYRLRKGGKR